MNELRQLNLMKENGQDTCHSLLNNRPNCGNQAFFQISDMLISALEFLTRVKIGLSTIGILSALFLNRLRKTHQVHYFIHKSVFQNLEIFFIKCYYRTGTLLHSKPQYMNVIRIWQPKLGQRGSFWPNGPCVYFTKLCNRNVSLKPM